MPPEGVSYMDIAEFRKLGLVQEINRKILHPLGLALEVTIDDETGAERISGVWDCRDDPKGVIFGNLDEDDARRAYRLKAEEIKRGQARRAALGFVVQPLPELRMSDRILPREALASSSAPMDGPDAA